MMVCPMTRRLPPGVARLTMVLVLTAAGFAEARPTTFASDVAPLLFRHCVTCHRPDGASATSFLTYESARAHARQIVQMTAERVMPPWQPRWPARHVRGRPTPRHNEIDVFRRWLDDGLLEGEADPFLHLRSFPRGWELGQPDLVVTMPPIRSAPMGRICFGISCSRFRAIGCDTCGRGNSGQLARRPPRHDAG